MVAEYTCFQGSIIKQKRGHFYVAQFGYGTMVMNRTNPAAPAHVNTFGNSLVYKQFISGTTLYSLDWENGGVTLYDLGASQTAPPVLDSNEDGPGNQGTGIVLLGNYAYVSKVDYGIVVFDVSNKSDIKYVGECFLPEVTGLAGDGTFIYAVSHLSGLNVVI